MIKKKILVVIVCVAFLLSGCSPRLVGEAKAKEAGLAFINKVFDVNETDAEVTLEERPGLSYINGIQAHLGDEEPNRVYVIKVNPDEIGNAEYYAEVNAVTGAAYRAERSISTIVLTDEQQKTANAIGTLEEYDTDSLMHTQQDAMSNAIEFLEGQLEPDVPIFRIYTDLMETDSVDFPNIRFGYIILMEDDTIYDLTILWPSMDLIGVYMRNQD